MMSTYKIESPLSPSKINNKQLINSFNSNDPIINPTENSIIQRSNNNSNISCIQQKQSLQETNFCSISQDVSLSQLNNIKPFQTSPILSTQLSQEEMSLQNLNQMAIDPEINKYSKQNISLEKEVQLKSIQQIKQNNEDQQTPFCLHLQQNLSIYYQDQAIHQNFQKLTQKLQLEHEISTNESMISQNSNKFHPTTFQTGNQIKEKQYFNNKGLKVDLEPFYSFKQIEQQQKFDANYFQRHFYDNPHTIYLQNEIKNGEEEVDKISQYCLDDVNIFQQQKVLIQSGLEQKEPFQNNSQEKQYQLSAQSNNEFEIKIDPFQKQEFINSLEIQNESLIQYDFSDQINNNIQEQIKRETIKNNQMNDYINQNCENLINNNNDNQNLIISSDSIENKKSNNSIFQNPNQHSLIIHQSNSPNILDSFHSHHNQSIKLENNNLVLETPIIIEKQILEEMTPMVIIKQDQQHETQINNQWLGNSQDRTEQQNSDSNNCTLCKINIPSMKYQCQCKYVFSKGQCYEYSQQENEKQQNKQQSLITETKNKRQPFNLNSNLIHQKDIRKFKKNYVQNKKEYQHQLTEQQINIVDYAFLNGQNVLERIHFRTRTENEYKNIVELTHCMVETLTLNHDGHHFISNDIQRKQNDSVGKASCLQKRLTNTDYESQNIIQQSLPLFEKNDQPQSFYSPSFDFKPKQLQISIKLGDQLLAKSVLEQDQCCNIDLINNEQSAIRRNNNQQNKLMKFNNQIFEDTNGEENENGDYEFKRNGALQNEEGESFEKSSNLTSEQWFCIQQLQKHKKKNVAKNIMTAFKNFIANPLKFGYKQQQIASALACYNKSKKIEETFDEMQNKFLKYIVKKKFNHYTIKLLIQHPNYGEVFEYFLKQLSDFWLEQSKVHDIEAHLAMINFLKEAYNDIEIINQLKKYDKRKY